MPLLLYNSEKLRVHILLNLKDDLACYKRMKLITIRQWSETPPCGYELLLQGKLQPIQGATIVDQSVTIALAPDYKPPVTVPASPMATENKNAGTAESAVQKAEDVVTTMLAKGFVLGKDALNKAKTFDEKHGFTSTASATVASLDQKIGLSEKITMGTVLVNDKMREVDQKFQVTEKTKSAFAAAEQTVNSAGSAIMKNRYILTGASWVTGAFNRVAKAAEEVGQKTREKMEEEERVRNMVEGYSQISESGSPDKALTSEQPSKPAAAQGLIL
ncbi:hypothetical protein Cgig2_023365 [Carnegiea gigantea]|uniref:Binding partner of ACD11 1-like n=1 Tax=Carnegiea gigantea TaxID=171969 RepID=A0A9Q1GPL4_9CARY|nr:hypothetical protein Cgig2_023365 [Carnegiea gigantea]